METVERKLEREMREWLLEVFSEEEDQEQIKELSYDQLVKAINRYYNGGIRMFLSVFTYNNNQIEDA